MPDNFYIILDPPVPLFAAEMQQLELWPAPMKLHPLQEAAMRRRLVGSKYQPPAQVAPDHRRDNCPDGSTTSLA